MKDANIHKTYVQFYVQWLLPLSQSNLFRQLFLYLIRVILIDGNDCQTMLLLTYT